MAKMTSCAFFAITNVNNVNRGAMTIITQFINIRGNMVSQLINFNQKRLELWNCMN